MNQNTFCRNCYRITSQCCCSPVKELTDEEITKIFDTTFEVRDYEDSFIKFARAILRKASEK